MAQSYTTTLGDHTISFEFGVFAEQADAAVTVRCGDTVLLATCVVSKNERDGIDYLPLMVDYEERLYAAGKISGSRFIKREGRPSEEAVLTARLIDRPMRPLFDKSFRKDIQVIVTVLSLDPAHDPDVFAMIAASAAASKAGTAPFKGPIGAVRIGRLNNELIVQPTTEQMLNSTLDLVIAGTRERIMMVEAGASEVPEAIVLEAMKLAHQAIQPTIDVQLQFKQAYPEVTVVPASVAVKEAVYGFVGERIATLLGSGTLGSHKEELEALQAEAEVKFEGTHKKTEIKNAFQAVVDSVIRKNILTKEHRPDGRGILEVRPITASVGLLPRTHGSGLFTRGQTQALTIATLGSPGDEQMIDTMNEEGTKRYMHHYNFPPFSTGEVSPVRGASRREIGHGALAERALVPVIPSKDVFPYTIRLVSEILSSNGSSSMASVCGSTLALMDAGVPIIKPVSGVAMGLVTNDDASEFKVLTDLQGVEDFAGDMDFKIAGTTDGITAIQMDTKIAGLTWPIIEQTLTQAYTGRMHILGKMLEVIATPRPDLSAYAPRIITTRIPAEKIGELIGPGGKNINRIITEAGGKEVISIDIESDGLVLISSTDAAAAQQALAEVDAIGMVIAVGMTFDGVVVSFVRDRMDPNKAIGAIVEFAGHKSGMLHISQVSEERLESITQVISMGQEVRVRIAAIDPEKNKISLTLKGV